MIKPLPDGPFATIVADPPWPYDDALPGRGRGAKKHYVLMSMDEISIGMGLEVDRVAATNAHLYLWTTNGFAAEAWQIARDWGFVPETLITWVKTTDVANGPSTQLIIGDKPRLQMGMGHYYRGSTEQVVFAVRGRLAPLSHSVLNVLFAPRGKHSVKPAEFYKMVERMSPGPRLELFARGPRRGWSVWGNESGYLENEPQHRTVSAVGGIRQAQRDYEGREDE